MSTVQHLVLLLLSAFVSSMAAMAWGQGPLVHLIAVSLATLLSLYSLTQSDLLGDLGQYGKLQVTSSIVYAFVAVTVCAEAYSGNLDGIKLGLTVLGSCQVLGILYAGASHDARFLLVNNLVMFLIALLPGGYLTAVTASGFLFLGVLWLVTDHCHASHAAVDQVIPNAVPLGAIVAIPVAALLLLFPPKPHAAIRVTLDTQQLATGGLIQDAVVLVLLVGLAIFVLRRLRPASSGRGESEELEVQEMEFSLQQRIEGAQRWLDSAPSEARRQILQLYDDIDQQLHALGYERLHGETIRSRSRRLRSLLGNEGGVLANIAERCRYGQQEPTAEHLQLAQRSAAEIRRRLPSGVR